MNDDSMLRDPQPINALPPARVRWYTALFAVTIGVALFGFLKGIREPGQDERTRPVESVPAVGVPSAVAYTEMPTARLGPNAHRQQSLADLMFDKPGIFDPVVRTEEMKLSALADRARNRAYDGAPPTIPHPVEAQSAAACLACHGEGVKIGERFASKLSHPHYSNCTQCHVEQAQVPVENSFVGIYRAGPGERASPGAPPTIPHHTWMRENCVSCHGLVTRPGLRTTHPWLTNCTQCHAPSAALNQVDFTGDRK